MRIVFMGTPTFAERCLSALLGAGLPVVGLVAQPTRLAGRGRRPAVPPTVALAAAHGVPTVQPPDPHAPAALETLREWAPTVIVVAAYGEILRSEILTLPLHGCLNVHASLLPRHRGACPIPSAILAGDRQTGVTIMLLDSGVDTGPLLAQRAIPIPDADTTVTLTDKLADLGAELLAEILPRWAQGEIDPQPQDAALATHSCTLCKEDGRLDWARPAPELWRRVRAYLPWPGTYTYWQGTLLKILQARPVDESVPGQPGLVIELGREPAVVTGAGVLLLERVQQAGKKPVDGATFLRGRRDFAGAVLPS